MTIVTSGAGVAHSGVTWCSPPPSSASQRSAMASATSFRGPVGVGGRERGRRVPVAGLFQEHAHEPAKVRRLLRRLHDQRDAPLLQPERERELLARAAAAAGAACRRAARRRPCQTPRGRPLGRLPRAPGPCAPGGRRSGGLRARDAFPAPRSAPARGRPWPLAERRGRRAAARSARPPGRRRRRRGGAPGPSGHAGGSPSPTLMSGPQ